jgi:hypothetical protein
VFYFSMGYWRKGQVNMEPGDTVTADVRVPDPEKLVAMLPVMDPNAPGAIPPPPGGRPLPGQPFGPGEREVGPRGVPRDVDRGLPQPPAPMPANPDEPAAVDPATIMTTRTVEEDAMLLDVASTTVVTEQGIARTKTEDQAFLLNEDGRIVVRTPEGDRVASTYLRLLRSSERGDEALRPRAARPTGMPTDPGRDPSSPIPRKDEDGGGGGGG